MTPKAISKLETVDLLHNWQADISADGPQPVAGSYNLEGMYLFRAHGCDFEIELMNNGDMARSVVYALPDRDLILFLPPANYAFWVRSLGPMIGDSALRLERMNVIQKMCFYVGKAITVFRRPPKELIGSLRMALRRILAPASARLPVAARAGTGVAPAIGTESSPRRPVLIPADEVPPTLLAVSIIIPTKENYWLLRACIDSLAMIEDVVIEIIIVDNGATSEDMCTYLDSLAAKTEAGLDVTVLRRPIPFNFSQLCNDGAQLARHPLLLFLNDDIEALDGDWLHHMCAFAARPDTGVVGARLLFEDRTLQHGGVASNLVPGPGHPWRGASPDVWMYHPLLAKAGEVDAVTGACLMIGRELFDSLGGFDAEAFKITVNDVDLCLRVRERGLKVVYVPQATLLHKEGQTRASDDRPSERARRVMELRAFLNRHPIASRVSCFYPLNLRRDTDTGAAIF